MLELVEPEQADRSEPERPEGIEAWEFGPVDAEDQPAADPPPVGELALRFKDYLFLRLLSSRLRTRLSEDLRSRRLAD